MSVPQTTTGDSYTQLSTELGVEEFTPALVRTVFKTIMPKELVGNPDAYDYMGLFLRQCARTGLDPIAGQLTPAWIDGKFVVLSRIDGFRAIAERTKEMDGEEGPFFCGPDGIWKDVWLEEGPPTACKITVFRKGHSRGYMMVAKWSEYAKPNSRSWKNYPTVMLAKCAEALAKRKAFPQDLSSLYIFEEFGRDEPGQQPQQPPAGTPVEQPKAQPEPEPTPEPASPAEKDELVPPVDLVTMKEVKQKAKYKCAICNKVPEVGDQIAYAKWKDKHWIAHWDEYVQATDGEDVVDGEYEEVEETPTEDLPEFKERCDECGEHEHKPLAEGEPPCPKCGRGNPGEE